MLHWNLCRETSEHFSLHQINQSRLDLKVLSEAGWRNYGRARYAEGFSARSEQLAPAVARPVMQLVEQLVHALEWSAASDASAAASVAL